MSRIVVATAKSPGQSWETVGAMMLAGTTAIHLLTATGVTDGDCVLIHGAAARSY